MLADATADLPDTPYIFQRLRPYYRTWQNRPNPKGFRRMAKMGQCFANAGRLAMKNPSIIYVEGAATFKGGFLEHAFCADQDGNVIDPTWEYEENRIHVGIPFRLSWVMRCLHKNEQWWATLFHAQAMKPAELLPYVHTDLLTLIGEHHA